MYRLFNDALNQYFYKINELQFGLPVVLTLACIVSFMHTVHKCLEHI